jgi:diguanylate cyclase (GGDEF)-like protein
VGLEEIDGYVTIVERLRAELSKPVHLHNSELQVSASIGVAIYSQLDEFSDQQLMRHADQAMYHAKVCGKNQYRLYHEHFEQAAQV